CNSRRLEEGRLWPFRPVAGPSQLSPALVPKRRSLVAGSPNNDLGSYIDDFERLRGKRRVWFLFTHTAPVNESDLEFSLSREGRQLQALREGAAVLLLYDLRS